MNIYKIILLTKINNFSLDNQYWEKLCGLGHGFLGIEIKKELKNLRF